MNPIHKILVVIDQFENEHPALSRALQMQHAPNTEITLFTNMYNSTIDSSFILDPENLDAVKQSMIDYQQKKLQHLIDNSQSGNISFRYKVEWQDLGYISEINYIDNYQPDLVIKSCQPGSRISQWLFNSSNSQLLKACACPILFVHNASLHVDGPVLAAVDPGHRLNQSSRLDEKVLTAGNAIASTLNVPLHACHCFDPGYWEVFVQAVKTANIWADVFPGNTDGDNHHVMEELREQHYSLFAQACKEWVPHVEHRHFIKGSVGDSLPQLAYLAAQQKKFSRMQKLTCL